MKKNYQSSLEYAMGYILLYLFSFSCYGSIISLLFDSADLYSFLIENKLEILTIFGTSIFLYLGITNNDFTLTDNSLIVKSRIPLFKKEKSFPLIKIKEVIISSEWTENILKNYLKGTLRFIIVDFLLALFFPPNYKWVKIIDTQGKNLSV